MAKRQWPGTKSLKLTAAPGRLAADAVIPAILHRKYLYFYGANGEQHVEGIKFWSRSGREIVNFTKIHYDNGVAKQSVHRTNGSYKRLFAFSRMPEAYMIDQGSLSDDVAPSYFLECLLYNVPDAAFGQSYKTPSYRYGTGFGKTHQATRFAARMDSYYCLALRRSNGRFRMRRCCWRR